MTQHLNLGDRRAFALLRAWLRATDRAATQAGGALSATDANVRALAEAAAAPGEQQLDTFLADVSDRVITSARALAGPAQSVQIEPQLQAFAAESRRVDCAACSPARVCRGDAGDDAAVHARGFCLTEVHDAFAEAVRISEDVYRMEGKYADPPPALTLTTTGVSEPTRAIPGTPLAINGSTFYQDDANRAQSIVRLSIAATHLDRFSLDALPYVTLHEVFCHGFQMARRSGARPNRGSVADPISEGLMDAVVVALLEVQAQALMGNPAHASADAAADAGRQLHLARTSTSREPGFREAAEAQLGSHAFKLLQHHFGELNRPLRGSTTLALACALNLQGWGHADRNFATSRLVHGLQRPRDVDLVAALAGFQASGDVSPLMEWLTRE